MCVCVCVCVCVSQTGLEVAEASTQPSILLRGWLQLLAGDIHCKRIPLLSVCGGGRRKIECLLPFRCPGELKLCK